jgi:hypothetical protein
MLTADEPREIARKAGGGVSHVPQGARAFIGLNYSMNRRTSGPKPSTERLAHSIWRLGSHVGQFGIELLTPAEILKRI